MSDKTNPILSVITPLLSERVILLNEVHTKAMIARAVGALDVLRSETKSETDYVSPDITAANDTGEGFSVGEGVVCIQIRGVLTKTPLPFPYDALDEFFGLCPAYRVMQELSEAVENSNVNEVVLDIDSPGGYVNGSFELADAVAAANQVKPVVAVVRGLCCSGAYLIASQCEKIIARRESLVGNIGAYSVLTDEAKFWEDWGITMTVVASGRFKGLGADGKVTQDLIDETKHMIDGTYRQFVAAVVSGRGMSEEEVRAVGDGRAFLGAEAKANGLIDELASSFDGALSIVKAATAAEENAMAKARATAAPAAATTTASTAAAAKAEEKKEGEGAPEQPDSKAKLHDAMDKALKSADKHKDDVRAAMDAHTQFQGQPEDETHTKAKQLVSSLRATMDEAGRCADLFEDGVGGGDGNDDDEPDEASKAAAAAAGGAQTQAPGAPVAQQGGFGKADFVKAFGEEKGLVFFGKDMTFADATAAFIAETAASHKTKCDAYDAQIAGLKAENEQLKQKLGAVDRGNEPASFSVASEPKGEAGKGQRQSFNGLRPGLKNYADSLKMPGK